MYTNVRVEKLSEGKKENRRFLLFLTCWNIPPYGLSTLFQVLSGFFSRTSGKMMEAVVCLRVPGCPGYIFFLHFQELSQYY